MRDNNESVRGRVVAWMLEYIEDGEVEREYNGHDQFSFGRRGGQPLVLATDYAAIVAERDALRSDAARWRLCVERDVMPVIANDGKTWCMFTPITSNRRSLFTGATPAEAIDAAIAAQQAEGEDS